MVRVVPHSGTAVYSRRSQAPPTEGARDGSTHLDPRAASAGPGEGGDRAEEARGAEGAAEGRQQDPEGRAVRVCRRHRRQDEGVQRAGVAARRRQGAGAEADGGARHLRQPSRPRTRRQAARDAARSLRQEVGPQLPPREGSLFVVAGPSGVGKGTVVRRVHDLDPDLYVSVSVTTRRPRATERDGVDYFFI